ncbi:hypothetical protein ACXWRH_09050, partial [Streptococcus pyogenes]
LETFNSFVEQVYSAQKTLQSINQQKRPTEKSYRTDRALNIKQEPVVRVKQEILDDRNSHNNSHNSEDLDIELDVNGIQEQLENESQCYEQK